MLYGKKESAASRDTPNTQLEPGRATHSTNKKQGKCALNTFNQ
jgi:hypothetical protein